MAKFTLRRIHLNSGGYDSSGAYYGVDAPLYRADTDDIQGVHYYGLLPLELRALSRDAAKDKVRAVYPGATFYR